MGEIEEMPFPKGRRKIRFNSRLLSFKRQCPKAKINKERLRILRSMKKQPFIDLIKMCKKECKKKCKKRK